MASHGGPLFARLARLNVRPQPLIAVLAVLALIVFGWYGTRWRFRQELRARALRSGHYDAQFDSVAPAWIVGLSDAIDQSRPPARQLRIARWPIFLQTRYVTLWGERHKPFHEFAAFDDAAEVAVEDSSGKHPEVYQALSRFRRLKRLDLYFANPTRREFEALRSLSSDLTIEVKASPPAIENLSVLADVPNVTGLVLHQHNDRSFDLSCLAGLRHLRSLTLHVDGRPRHVSSLADLSLTCLDLSGCEDLHDDDLASLGHLKVAELRLSGPALTERGYRSLGHMTRLRTLALTRGLVDAPTLARLSPQTVTALRLEDCNIPPQSPTQGVLWPRLTQLSLIDVHGNTDLALRLAQHPRLELFESNDRRLDKRHAQVLATCNQLGVIRVPLHGSHREFVSEIRLLRPDIRLENLEPTW